MLEIETWSRFPNLVVASLGAQKKEKSGGMISALKLGEVAFGLTADVKEAHRHLLGCQLERGGGVFVNIVGTFGVSSASYYCWSRVSAAVGRLTQYLISRYATITLKLVVRIFDLPSWCSSSCAKSLAAHFPGTRQTEERSPTGSVSSCF